MCRVICVVIMLFVVLQVEELRAEVISYEKALKLKKDKNYTQAEQAFLSLIKTSKQNAEFWFQLGLIQRYQQNFLEALVSQTRAIELSPNNADIKLELARLYSWNLEFDRAEILVKEVVAKYPDYQDAITLEETIRRNKLLKVDPIRYKWNVSTGYEQSDFSRKVQPNWYTTFLQIENWVNPKTLLHIRAENKERYNEHGEYYEFGIAHIFADYFNGQFSAGGTSNNSPFIPQWKLKTRANLRVIHGHDKLGDTWLTGYVEHNRYENSIGTTIKPGIRYEITDNLQIHGQSVNVMDEEGNHLSGWEAKLGWQTPFPKLRLFGGVSDTPEGQSTNQGMIEVDTHGYFGGFSYQIVPRATIHASYARDDRENSFIREIVSVALSVKF
jgi:YaiO family outer membrane protein